MTMATDKRIVRKNGVPVKRFWTEKSTKRTREDHITTYPVYFHGQGVTTWELTEEKAPRSLREALHTAKVMIESPEQPQTYAAIYELRVIYRMGTEFDYKLHEAEQKAAHEEAQRDPAKRFTLIRTTGDQP